MTAPLRRLQGAFAAAVLLSGCASAPDAVLQLAERTGANAGILGAQLDKLDRDRAEISEARAQALARLHGANTELRARYDFDVLLARKAGQAGDLDAIKKLDDWHKEAEEIFRNVDAAAGAREAEILSRITQLDTKAEALKAVASRLAKLAEADKPEDRVRFLAGFAKQVRNDAQTQLSQDDPSAKNAKEFLGKLGVKASPPKDGN